jgi:hypothetical protein
VVAYNAYNAVQSPTTQVIVEEQVLGGNTILMVNALMVLIVAGFFIFTSTPCFRTADSKIKK